MIHVATDHASTPAISDRQWRRIMDLDWNGPHTARVREGTGVQTLCVAYDQHPDRFPGPCWLIAQRVICKVFESGTHRDMGTHSVPYTWAEWRDEDGTARSIDDPRLIPFIMSRDRHRRGHHIDAERDAADVQKAQDEDKKRLELASDRDVRRAVKAFGEAKGIVAHRKLGTAGGRISTAAIWRSGAGAPQKPVRILDAQGRPIAAN